MDVAKSSRSSESIENGSSSEVTQREDIIVLTNSKSTDSNSTTVLIDFEAENSAPQLAQSGSSDSVENVQKKRFFKRKKK